jgi:PA domain/Leishmanolysin
MRRYWLGFGLLLLLALAACSGGATTETPEDTTVIEMSLRTPSQSNVQAQALTTTTSALQVLGLINPPGVKITYSVNGGEAKPVQIVDGSFTFLATLQAGKNKIAVTASLIFNPKIKLTKTLEVTYEPTVPGGLTYGGVLDRKGPVFTRPDEGSGLTDAQRTNPYNVYEFNIDKKDWYSVFSGQLFDGYLLLYKGSFNPAKPSENLLAQNDDFQGGFDPDAEIPGRSRVRAELVPGKYVAVTTAFTTPGKDDKLEFSNVVETTDPPPPPFRLPTPDDSKFNITVRFLTTNVTAQQQAAFVDAANRWGEVITGDLTNVTLSQPIELNPNGAAVVGVIDDILIDSSFTDIDGPGQVLGRAGPGIIRSSGPNKGLTIYGSMEFDIAEFEPGGIFEDAAVYKTTILHEMGHVLGVGTLWVNSNNVADYNPDAPTDVPAGTPNPNYDPRFIGKGASAEYAALLQQAGKTDKAGVPIENTAGPGTINGHWREFTFDNELMTGFVAPDGPFSRMTAASMGDLGYTVNVAASDAYTLPVDPLFSQTAPNAVTYVYAKDFLKLGNALGSTTGTVQAVDLKLDKPANPADPASNHPANSTSGCEPADFAGFTKGNIALVQRGKCPFVDKVDNATAAGASGVIIMNQGNDETPARNGIFLGSSTGLPGVSVPFALGVAFSKTTGLKVSIDTRTKANLLAAAATKPAFEEELLQPFGTISENGKLGSLPQ